MTSTKQASLLLSLLNMHYEQHKTSISILLGRTGFIHDDEQVQIVRKQQLCFTVAQ